MKPGTSKILLLILCFGLLVSSCEKKDIDIDLTANAWKVIKIRSSGQQTYVNTDSSYIFRFWDEENFSLNLDVNTCGGKYKIPHKGSIDFQELACTEICCDSDFAQDMAGLLPHLTDYYFRNNKLYFEGDGEIILQKQD